MCNIYLVLNINFCINNYFAIFIIHFHMCNFNLKIFHLIINYSIFYYLLIILSFINNII